MNAKYVNLHSILDYKYLYKVYFDAKKNSGKCLRLEEQKGKMNAARKSRSPAIP